MAFIKMDRNTPAAKDLIKNQIRLLLKFHNLDHDLLKQNYLSRGFSQSLVDQAIAEVLAEPGVTIEGKQ